MREQLARGDRRFMAKLDHAPNLIRQGLDGIGSVTFTLWKWDHLIFNFNDQSGVRINSSASLFGIEGKKALGFQIVVVKLLHGEPPV